MKKGIGIVVAIAAICGLTWGFLELREEGYLSSYAAQPETPAPLQAAGASFTYDFDHDTVGAMPAKFHSARTGQGAASKWEVMADPNAPSKPNVVAQTSTDKTDYRFPLLITDDGSFQDLNLRVKFKAVSGEVDRAGGLVFRLKDANNYYIVRANALEDNFRLYTYDRGRRQIASASVKAPALGQWHAVRVVAVGDHIQAWLDGKLLLDHRDARFKSGRVGLWTKADSITAFADLTVRGVTAGA